MSTRGLVACLAGGVLVPAAALGDAHDFEAAAVGALPTGWAVANAGAFYDPRGSSTERGWRASALAEFPRDRLRPGVELFVRDSNTTGTRMQAGVGLIASLERVEIRTGLHVGLNDAAPDLEASVWLSWKWQVPNAAR